MEQAAKPAEAPKPRSRTMVLAIIVVVILVVVGVGIYILLPKTSGPPIGEKLSIWDTSGSCLQTASPPNCGYKDASGSSNVTVAVGTTVQWTNNSPSLPHTVTSCDTTHYNSYHSYGACPNGPDSSSLSFDSGNIAQNGGTYQYTFNTAGKYYYFCTVHPWMNAEIIVQ